MSVLELNIFQLAFENPGRHLPSLYSLALAFYCADGTRPFVETLSRVWELFVTTDGDHEHINRGVGTNLFAAAAYGSAVSHKPLSDPQAGMVLGRLQRGLFVEPDMIRWKGIHLPAALAHIVDDIQLRPECIATKQPPEGLRNEQRAAGKPTAYPDWYG